MKADARFALVLLAALTAAGCDLDFLKYGPGADAAKAEKRVNSMLAAMKKAGDTTSVDLQEGLSRWYNGQRVVSDLLELDAAMQGFDRWRRERNLYNRRIASYEITGSEVVPDSDPPAVVVTVTIEGKTHQILVPEDRPMSWHGKAPR